MTARVAHSFKFDFFEYYPSPLDEAVILCAWSIKGTQFVTLILASFTVPVTGMQYRRLNINSATESPCNVQKSTNPLKINTLERVPKTFGMCTFLAFMV